MANYIKKVSKAAEGDLQPGEQITAGVFLQASGATGKAMARGVGGLVGAAVASKLKSKDDGTIVSDSGIAATMPDGPIHVAVTSQRALVYSHGAMSGKPKDLKLTLQRGDIAGVALEPGKLTTQLTLMFSDGTGKVYEAPKMGNSADEFAAAINV
jgi:hypothetical protein